MQQQKVNARSSEGTLLHLYVNALKWYGNVIAQLRLLSCLYRGKPLNEEGFEALATSARASDLVLVTGDGLNAEVRRAAGMFPDVSFTVLAFGEGGENTVADARVMGVGSPHPLSTLHVFEL